LSRDIWIFGSKSRGWRCGCEREVERCPSFREIGSLFGRVTRQEGIFEHNSGRHLLHATFLRSVITECRQLQSNWSLYRIDHCQEKA